MMNTKFTTPFVKIKVGVLRDSCAPSGEATCDSSELSKRIKELHSKAIVIVGVTHLDRSHSGLNGWRLPYLFPDG